MKRIVVAVLALLMALPACLAEQAPVIEWLDRETSAPAPTFVFLPTPTPQPTAEPTAVPTAEPTAVPTAVPTPEPAMIYMEALERGDRGGRVVSLQKVLIMLGYLSGSADGDYGRKTEEAVLLAQERAGLTASGVADSLFLSELYTGRIPSANGSQARLAPQVVDYGETSHHTERAGAYTVGNVFDGKTHTCWAEGASGYGIGEGISFTVATFGAPSVTLNIYSGYHKSSQRYRQNGRPRDITLYVDGVPQPYTFSDAMAPEAITIDDLEGRWFVGFRITIDSVYKGNTWSDTCISEIEIR